MGRDVVVLDRDTAPVGRWTNADPTDAEETRGALDAALADGPVTRLVNSVGAVVSARPGDQKLDEVDLAHQLNLRCAGQRAQAMPSMKDSGFGRIVDMISCASLGKELRTAYSASKTGLLGVTRTWALELGAHGITVNVIGPPPDQH